MRPDDLEEMRRIPFFASASPAQVEAMLKAAFLQRFPAMVELIREHEPADFLHVIIEGQVETYSAYRDRETTIAVQGPGDSFILAAVLLDRIYLKSARTLTPARILMIPADAVRTASETDLGFCRTLNHDLARSYRAVVKELKNQKLRPSLERIANWLLAQDVEQGGRGVVVLPFDKKVLASRLGMVPEVLSRSFHALAAYGVSVNGARVEIADHAALRKLAQPSDTMDDPAT
jgi:CRP/FNR family transcriptional activator FtrB